METVVLSLAIAALLGGFFVAELRRAPARSAEALYLVHRVGSRNGFEVCEKPLSLRLPWGTGRAELHYHLLTSDRHDSITLTDERGAPSRLGNLVITNAPARSFSTLRRLGFETSQFDRHFQVLADPDRHAGVVNLLEANAEILFLLKDLASRSRHCRFELLDLEGRIKIQLTDRRLRFPSEVESITLDLVRLLKLYQIVAGDRDPRQDF